MLEFYVESKNTASIDIYVNDQLSDPGSVTVSVENLTDGSTVVAAGTSAQRESEGKYFYVLPASASAQPHTLKLTWTYDISGEIINDVEIISVVVPYTNPAEIKATYSALADKTTAQLQEMERTVRYIINDYCGQIFNYELAATKTAYGDGNDVLQLPRRLYEFTSLTFSGTDLTPYVEQRSDEPNQLVVKRTWPDEIKKGLVDLDQRYRFFTSGRAYRVTGNWGWQWVPGEVQRAALMLVELYYCPEATYHDRHITSMRIGDRNMEFGVTGTQTTGSAKADMILRPYRRHQWTII